MMWESKALLAQACVIEDDSSLYSPSLRKKVDGKTKKRPCWDVPCHYHVNIDRVILLPYYTHYRVITKSSIWGPWYLRLASGPAPLRAWWPSLPPMEINESWNVIWLSSDDSMYDWYDSISTPWCFLLLVIKYQQWEHGTSKTLRSATFSDGKEVMSCAP